MPYDPNTGNPGEATALASPAVALQDRYRRDMQAQAAKLAQEQQQQALEASRQAKLDAANQRTASAGTMASDAAQWAVAPEYAGQSFAQAPAEAKQHFMSAYPELSATAPQAWNTAQRNVSGNPHIGLENLQPGEVAAVDVNGDRIQVGRPAPDKGINSARTRYSQAGLSGLPADATVEDYNDAIAQKRQADAEAKANSVPNTTKQELIRMKAWKNGMTAEDAGPALDAAYIASGQIPDKYRPAAVSISTQILHDPVLSVFAKRQDAFDTMKSGMENPGGFGDMAMIEGYQRIVNPGAIVRQGTMDNMKNAVGWLNKILPSQLVNRAIRGDSLTQEGRQILMKIAEDEFKKKRQEVDLQFQGKADQARSYGIPSPDNFVRSVLRTAAHAVPDQQPTSTTATPPQTGQTVLMVSPNGTHVNFPIVSVEAARARGYSPIQ